MNRYTVSFHAKCPGNGVRIEYHLTIEAEHTVMVEDILEIVEDNTREPVYHEKLADDLARMLPGLHRMWAHHHGVHIETERIGK